MLIWNKEELPHQWKESIVVPIDKKGNKTDCSNYRGISLLSTSYKILSNILLSRLIPYADEIIGDHQCGFQRNLPKIHSDPIFPPMTRSSQWSLSFGLAHQNPVYFSLLSDAYHMPHTPHSP
jgi:hypothetical protein